MNNSGSNVGCPCTVCAKKGSKIPNIGAQKTLAPRAAAAAAAAEPRPLPVGRSRGRPPQAGKLDSEGTPDVYRNLLNKLKAAREVDEAIEEKYSLDWRAERESLLELLRAVSEQPAWVPRQTEIVLFVRDLRESEELSYDARESAFRIYNTAQRIFDRYPAWEAGVVTQVASEQVTVDDLVLERDKKNAVNYSGFRIEPLPDPNDPESKHLSKLHKYVPLHHIRPFAFWEELHANRPNLDYDRTVKSAMTVSSSFSLVEKYRFKGTWPSASVYCQAIYLGPEMLLVGDVVRVAPSSDSQQDEVTDILQITEIKLNFSNLNVASDNDNDEGRPYNTSVTICGKGYTIDPHRAASSKAVHTEAINTKLHDISSHHLSLFPRHRPSQCIQIPFNRILGRCYEAEAMLLWFPDTESPNLSAGLRGTLRAREYAQKHDKRITRRESKKWFWAETRTEALDLETVNGMDVFRKDHTRQPRKWVQHLRVLDGTMGADEKSKLVGQAAAAATSARRMPRLGKYLYSSEVSRSAAESEAESGGRKRSVSLAGLDDAEDTGSRGSRNSVPASAPPDGDKGDEEDLDRFVDGLVQGRIPIPDNEDVVMLSD